MSDAEKRPISFWNVPNILTFTRIFLSIALFIVVPFELYALALILFSVGALTDFFDGWWARKFQQVTKFGRIADPFADKLLICGTLIFLVAIQELRVPCECLGGINVGIASWMVVVIVSRELLVTQLRSLIEAGGGNFSAKRSGKLKMACQCTAVIACFLYLVALRYAGICPLLDRVLLPFFKWGMVAFLWATVYLTLDSCVKYVIAAIRFSRTSGEKESCS